MCFFDYEVLVFGFGVKLLSMFNFIVGGYLEVVFFCMVFFGYIEKIFEKYSLAFGFR